MKPNLAPNKIFQQKYKTEAINMLNPMTSWQLWAILAALFAALTAIFAKVGVADIDSDLATLVRTIVIFFVLAGILIVTGKLELNAILNLSRRKLSLPRTMNTSAGQCCNLMGRRLAWVASNGTALSTSSKIRKSSARLTISKRMKKSPATLFLSRYGAARLSSLCGGNRYLAAGG
jgi:hypothetical protein